MAGSSIYSTEGWQGNVSIPCEGAGPLACFS